MSDAASQSPHLIHGMGKELEAPAWPHLTETEVQAILMQFPLAGTLRNLSWHSPRPFSATSLVETTQSAFFLKRHHHSLRSVEDLAAEHAFMAHLRMCGLPVPEVMLTHTGKTAVTDEPWTYELHRQSCGLDLYRDRQSWTPFLETNHGFESGVALARLHQAAQTFHAPQRIGKPLISSMTILSADDPLAAFEAYQNTRPALSSYLADKPWRQIFETLMQELGQGLPERIAAQPSLWTHNDWHPSNLLWSPEGHVVSIFDFGLATRTCALHDLATAIERTAIPWLEPHFGPGDTDAALAIIAGYHSILPLSIKNMQTLLQLIPLVHVEFALSEVDYFYGLLTDRKQADLAWYDYFIGHAQWFQSDNGAQFLHALKSGISD